MQQNQGKPPHVFPRAVIGLLLLGAGLLLLASKLFTGVPGWLVSWPMLAIVAGLFISVQQRFRHFWALALFFWGLYLLLDQQMPQWQMHRYMAPICIIVVGLLFLLQRRQFKIRSKEWSEAFIDVTIALGNVEEKVLSKPFKGGDISCFLGGAEIDLRQAEIEDEARLDITCFMGGTKLLIPAHWTVKSDLTAIFSGIEDKRKPSTVVTDEKPKLLLLDGTAFMGGIEISSY